jgi:hypothetical protein
MGDVILEMKRDDAGFYLLDHPGATDEEIVRGLFHLAKDRRAGPQGKGVLIHDERGQDRVWQRFATKWAIGTVSPVSPSHRRGCKGRLHARSQVERVVQSRAVPVEIERVLAEPVDVLREIRAEP